MDKEKSVDESWKETAAQEKESIDANSDGTQDNASSATQEQGSGASEEMKPIEINFINYVTSLGFQAMIFIGEIPNPITSQAEKNLVQAKFIIDTLVMLKEKTKGNLNEQESGLLESSVYELQMKYVEAVKKEEAGDQSASGGQSE